MTLSCVSNEVGGDLIGNAAGSACRSTGCSSWPRAERGTQVVGRSVDGFTVGFPTHDRARRSGALIAVGMNGEPLPMDTVFLRG